MILIFNLFRTQDNKRLNTDQCHQGASDSLWGLFKANGGDHFAWEANWFRLTLLYSEQYGRSRDLDASNWYDISMNLADNVLKRPGNEEQDKPLRLALDKFNLSWEIGKGAFRDDLGFGNELFSFGTRVLRANPAHLGACMYSDSYSKDDKCHLWG